MNRDKIYIVDAMDFCKQFLTSSSWFEADWTGHNLEDSKIIFGEIKTDTEEFNGLVIWNQKEIEL